MFLIFFFFFFFSIVSLCYCQVRNEIWATTNKIELLGFFFFFQSHFCFVFISFALSLFQHWMESTGKFARNLEMI